MSDFEVNQAADKEMSEQIEKEFRAYEKTIQRLTTELERCKMGLSPDYSDKSLYTESEERTKRNTVERNKRQKKEFADYELAQDPVKLVETRDFIIEILIEKLRETRKDG